MNRLQFFILTGLSIVLVLLLLAHIALALSVGRGQANWAAAQQLATRGNVAQNGLKQLAMRIIQDSQRTADPGLKDLLARNQITYNPPTNSTETPAAPPSPSSH
jgi:hypothetical protein